MSNDEPRLIQESTPSGDSGAAPLELPKTQAEFFARAAEKVRSKFPHAPGRVSVPGPGRPRAVHRQGEGSAGPRRQLFPGCRGRRPAHRPPGARGLRRRFRRSRERGRCPADGSAAGEGHPAEIQPRAARRQELSLPADHHARGFSARRSDPRAAHQRRQAVRAVRQRRQPARRRAGAAEGVQVPHLLARHRGGR